MHASIAQLNAFLAPIFCPKYPPVRDPTIPTEAPKPKIRLAVATGTFNLVTRYIVVNAETAVDPNSLTTTNTRKIVNMEKRITVSFLVSCTLELDNFTR
jgi:hypothetical protein